MTARNWRRSSVISVFQSRSSNIGRDPRRVCSAFAAGKATGDRKLRTKGKRDQTKGSLKQAGEKVKDAVRKK